jgi:hypothetical protein
MEMGKETKRKTVNSDGESIVVSQAEYTIIAQFIQFIRGRERGIFKIRLIKNSGDRQALVDCTEQYKVELQKVS